MNEDETTVMNLIERKSVKLLALGAQRLAEMTAEALCDAPQGFVIRRQLADLRALLDEFEDAYFDPAEPPAA
jgi:predicted GNAT superfamily acetyltransferase